MPLTNDEAQLIGAAICESNERWNQLNQKLDRLESRPAADAFMNEVQDAHRYLRDRHGLSKEQIEQGEERMVRSRVGNYEAAQRLGYFGHGKPVLGGVRADRLQQLMTGDIEAATDLLIDDALAEVRGE